MSEILGHLESVILARKGADPSSSHTAKLLAKGSAKCAEKFGEEAVEAIIAAAQGDRDGLVSECADALYHMMIMLAAQDLSFSQVLAELERRQGVSGIAEKAARSGEIEIRPLRDEGELVQCHRIRRIVFMGEQGVAEAEEMDPHDPASTHYLALIGDEAVATARARMVDGVMKIQRVAVLKALRGRGIGRALVERIVEDHPEIDKFAISAQVEAVPFYRALGFAAHGHEYLDAGIPHRDMSLER